MMTIKEATVFLIVVVVCGVLVPAMGSVQDTASQNTLEINERGTAFAERIEVNDRNTLTYHVPAHNDVDQSDILIDYEQKLSVTRIPRVKECHVEELEKDVRSPEKVLMDVAKLKLIYKGNVKSVRTVEKTVIKVGKFDTTSPKIIEFCGTHLIFKMAVIKTVDSNDEPKGHDIQKRSMSKVSLSQLTSSSFNHDNDDDDDSPDDIDFGSGFSGSSGFLIAAASRGNAGRNHCDTLETYNLDDCIASPKKWKLTPKRASKTCMYNVECRSPSMVNSVLTPGECNEVHRSSSQVCYDLSCKPNLA